MSRLRLTCVALAVLSFASCSSNTPSTPTPATTTSVATTTIPPTTTTAPPTRFTVAGVVSDDQTGAAISGAFVQTTVAGAGSLTGTTDGNGYYSISGVSGTIGISATATGYFPGTAVTVTPNSDTRQDFKLRRQQPGVPSAEYRITGSARRCFVGYNAYPNGVLSIVLEEANIPFTYSWNGARRGDSLLITCQIDTVGDRGSLTVSIYKDGALYQSADVTGYLNRATVGGTY